MARSRDQTVRRRQLVSATRKVVARKGIAGAQLRDVAKAAGLTPGAVLYYFDGLDELFFAAYERGVERFCAEREKALAAVDDPRDALATVLRLGIPTGPDDHEIRLLYEFEAVAFRSRACADAMAAYVERQVVMYAGLLEAGAAAGAFALDGDPRALARNLVALEDGHGVYVLTGHVDRAEVEAMLLGAAGRLTGAPIGQP